MYNRCIHDCYVLFRILGPQSVNIQYSTISHAATIEGPLLPSLQELLFIWCVFPINCFRMKERMEKKNKISNERLWLFHGAPTEVHKAICEQGFDWRLAGDRVC